MPADHGLPNINFTPSWYFVIYLVIGLLTLFFYAKEKFDQATYPIEDTDPASIIIPSFLQSQTLYLRGFFLYLASMTGIYVALSLAGPALVTGVLKAYGLEWRPAGAFDPDQWPLVLALAIVGLTPNVPGFRVPELMVRRFSHRVALIPAYARDIAFRMQRASFEYPTGARLPAGIRYRPLPTSDQAIDQNWLKICVLSARVKSFSDGNVPDSGKPLNGAGKTGLQRELQIFYAALHDLDAQLYSLKQNGDTPDSEDHDKLDTTVLKLLSRAYLLFALALMGFRTRDISAETRRVGFPITVLDAPTLLPFLAVFFILFMTFLVRDASLLRMFSWSILIIPPSFSLSCISAANTVVTYSISLFAAFTCYRNLEARGTWQKANANWVPRFLAYFTVWGCGYLTSLIITSVLLFSTSLPTFDGLIFPIFLSLAPSASGILMATWLRRETFALPPFLMYVAICALMLAAVAGFASILLNPDDDRAILRTIFEATQGLMVGLAVSLLAEITRSYQRIVPSLLPDHAASGVTAPQQRVPI